MLLQGKAFQPRTCLAPTSTLRRKTESTAFPRIRERDSYHSGRSLNAEGNPPPPGHVKDLSSLAHEGTFHLPVRHLTTSAACSALSRCAHPGPSDTCTIKTPLGTRSSGPLHCKPLELAVLHFYLVLSCLETIWNGKDVFRHLGACIKSKYNE